MSMIKTAMTALALVGMGLSSSAFADTRAGTVAPRQALLSKATVSPKVQRRTDDGAVAGINSNDGSGVGIALALLGGVAIGAGGCAAAKCYGHTSP